MELVPLEKRLEDPFSLQPCEDTEVENKTLFVDALILDFSTSRTMSNKFMLFKKIIKNKKIYAVYKLPTLKSIAIAALTY